MQFLSSRKKDNVQLPLGEAGYEWWYFDVYDERSETTLVVIYYIGNPFSRRMFDRRTALFNQPANSHPALSVSLHRKGKPVFIGFREFEEKDLTLSNDTIHIGASFLEQNDQFWKLQLDFELPSKMQLRGVVRFDIGKDGWFHQPDPNDPHGWNLASLKCQASGQLVVLQNNIVSERIEIKGTGYHDHNWGIRPLHRDFLSWSWGRVHFPEASLVFYHKTLASGAMQSFGWLCRENSGTSEPVSITPVKSSRARFGFISPRLFHIEGRQFRAVLQHEVTLESGPFYQRFVSGVRYVLDGKSGISTGISEYIKADNIFKRRFRALIEMRVSYPGRKPHWVQRIPFLYRRTWL
jgi:carotenoid 1,2-hydratase